MKTDHMAEIGAAGLHVTGLGMGGATLGGLYEEVTEETAIETVRQTLALGINYLDTAPLYGHGKSETRMGQALAGIPRDSYVLSTKVGRLLVPEKPDKVESIWFKNLPPYMPIFDFSYDGVMRSLECSLKRLNLDRVDLLYIHDPENAFEEVMKGAYPALEKLRDEGVIRAIGVACWDLDLLCRFATTSGFDCLMLPGHYTLLDQSALDRLLPVCLREGIRIVAAAPFCSGILASGARPGAKFNYADATPEVLDKVRQIEAICLRHGVPLAAAALQFPGMHPAVATVVPGARTPQEIEDNFQMMALSIPSEFWEELREHGLVHPEAPIRRHPEAAVQKESHS